MKFIKSLSVVFISLMMLACGGGKVDESTSANVSDGEAADAADAVENEETKAILLWDASIADGITKDKKWIATYQFGNTLTLTGKTEENAEEKRTYAEVTGPDGKTGWINQNLFVTNSAVNVAVADIPLYKNPDIMSVSSNTLKAGDIVAVSAENKNGFYEVFGKEKRVKGFINNLSLISSDPVDLKVALFYEKALAEKTSADQGKALQAIIDDGSNSSSKLYSLVQDKLEEHAGVNDDGVTYEDEEGTEEPLESN